MSSEPNPLDHFAPFGSFPTPLNQNSPRIHILSILFFSMRPRIHQFGMAFIRRSKINMFAVNGIRLLYCFEVILTLIYTI